MIHPYFLMVHNGLYWFLSRAPASWGSCHLPLPMRECVAVALYWGPHGTRRWAKYLMFIFSFNNNLEEHVCLLIIYISVFNPLSIFFSLGLIFLCSLYEFCMWWLYTILPVFVDFSLFAYLLVLVTLLVIYKFYFLCDPKYKFFVVFFIAFMPWHGFLRWLSGKKPACNAGDVGLIPGSGRPPGEGISNPLQFFCL